MSHAEAVEQSIWLQERPDRGEPLTGPLDVDVAIVGGGITGLTAAGLIASDGKRVAVLEAHAVGAGTSGANSAHVSAVPDAGYRAVARRCGIASGREYVARLNAALELMDSLVEAERIGCDWARVPAFWFSERGDDLERLRDEARAADELGQECHIVADVPLPWPVAGGLQFPRQARFHPMRYLSGLARVARARGAALYEATPALAWKETATGVTLHTPRAEVRAGALILATHTPIGFNILQTELTPAQSYMLVLSLPDPLADALFWDTADPYHYLRPLAFDGQTLALVGGADHKTG
ncbi:MAG: NAD(P)/FAD-dependent oxidoreductase, partial [Candidatus Binatia bacterium]